MQITLTDCAGHVIRSFPTLVAFVAGGTLTEASGGTAPALQTGGKGVWSHTTDSTYAFRFKDFNFNSSYVLTGWSIISGETTVDATGNATAGPATVQVYDPNGNLLATLCADAVGTRFELWPVVGFGAFHPRQIRYCLLPVQIRSPVSERFYATANWPDKVFRQIGLNKFFAVRWGGRNRDSARIDNRGAATKP
jgi:hypothetical protein